MRSGTSRTRDTTRYIYTLCSIDPTSYSTRTADQPRCGSLTTTSERRSSWPARRHHALRYLHEIRPTSRSIGYALHVILWDDVDFLRPTVNSNVAEEIISFVIMKQQS